MNVLRVTHGLVEIDRTHDGDLEVTGGVAILRGRVTGDVIVLGGQIMVSGIIDGNLDNQGGGARITGTVLGSITGSPAYTIVDVTEKHTGNPFGAWDPQAAEQPALRRERKASAKHAARTNPVTSGRIWTTLTAAAVAVATMAAALVVGDNTSVADSTSGAAIIEIVEKAFSPNN